MARKKTGRPTQRRGRRPLSMGKRILFGIAPLLILLGLGELGVRACWNPELLTSSNSTTVMEPHPTRLWAPRKGGHTAFGGSFTINEDRLREVALDGDPIRVITLGDSSIFGHGVEDDETLHAQIERNLSSRSVQADVLCGAIPGYSTEQSLRVMQEWGWEKQPSLLVIGNLWSDGARSTVTDREWYTRYESASSRLDLKMMAWSQLWTWLRSKLSEETETPVELIFERSPEGGRRVALQDYASNLDRLLVEAAQRGVSAILLSPCHEKMLVDQDFHTEMQAVGYFGAMHAVATHRGVPVVSACDVIREAGITRRQDAFVMMDPSHPELGNDPLHPSPASNQAYAAQIVEELSQRGWPTQSVLPRTDVSPFSQTLPPGPESL